MGKTVFDLKGTYEIIGHSKDGGISRISKCNLLTRRFLDGMFDALFPDASLLRMELGTGDAAPSEMDSALEHPIGEWIPEIRSRSGGVFKLAASLPDPSSGSVPFDFFREMGVSYDGELVSRATLPTDYDVRDLDELVVIWTLENKERS